MLVVSRSLAALLILSEPSSSGPSRSGYMEETSLAISLSISCCSGSVGFILELLLSIAIGESRSRPMLFLSFLGNSRVEVIVAGGFLTVFFPISEMNGRGFSLI